VLSDGLGQLWFPTPKGVFVVKKSELLAVADQKQPAVSYLLYGRDDGILEPECTGAAQSLTAQDGRIFIPTLGGLAVYNPNAHRVSHTAPVMHFERFLADGKEIDMYAPQILISPNIERVSIQYTAVNLTSPHEMLFRYRLNEGEWVEAGKEREAIYTNLPPGKHHFVVQVRSKNGIWPMQEASLVFYREAYFYETYWFYALVVLMLVLSAIALARVFYKVKLARIAAQNALLEAQVQERTIQLGEANEELKQINEELNATLETIDKERQKSDSLLRNILPAETAQELKENGVATPRSYELASIMFTDLKGFTSIAESLSPEDIIGELNICFSAFDKICEANGLEKIKTIGDGYLAVGGVPEPNETNAVDAVRAALQMQAFMKQWQQERLNKGLPVWRLRIGIHTGPVVAGVVGTHKFAYDIWGDSVNLAARMEQSGEADQVNISESTYQLVKEHFRCHARGKMQAKNKGMVDMYFVEGPQ
jgi:class 3 adenylate cyclase